MPRLKVLLFMVADLSYQHGGNLWLSNLLQNLAKVQDMDFFVVTAGRPEAHLSNERFVRAFGFDHTFVPFRERRGEHKRVGRPELWGTVLDKYYFLYEREARRQRHIDTEVDKIARAQQPDLIVVNDIWSAMCFPSAFSLGLPCCLITLNNEVEFHRLFRSQGAPLGNSLHDLLVRWLYRRCNGIANRRMHRYVTDVFSRCTGLIALTREDLPVGSVGHAVTAVLPPLLEESAAAWRYGGTHCLLFVGNASYFPNRLAVEWICRQLAPELHRIDSRIWIAIIGASVDQLHIDGLPPNVTFLGQCSREEVVQHMTNDDMFIAPIENRFGAKLKLAECASHGMPFIATRAAMTGLPFMTCIPEIHLNRPAEAACVVASYVNAPGSLMTLSQGIIDAMRTARLEQGAAWGTFLRRISTSDTDSASMSQLVRSG